MIKSAALVTQAWNKNTIKIRNLGAYLFQAYKRLLLAELEKINGHRQSEGELEARQELDLRDFTEDLDRKILILQIKSRMDPWTLNVFQYRSLGYNFKEIGSFLGQKEHTVQQAF